MDKLKKILEENGINYQVICHEKVVTIDDVKKELKIPVTLMAKSLIIKVKDELVIAVISGDDRLDKKKTANLINVNRKVIDLLPKEKVESVFGIPVGAIPPFGLPCRVIVDRKVLDHKIIYCGSGSLTTTLIVSPNDIVKITKATIGDISS